MTDSKLPEIFLSNNQLKDSKLAGKKQNKELYTVKFILYN